MASSHSVSPAKSLLLPPLHHIHPARPSRDSVETISSLSIIYLLKLAPIQLINHIVYKVLWVMLEG